MLTPVFPIFWLCPSKNSGPPITLACKCEDCVPLQVFLFLVSERYQSQQLTRICLLLKQNLCNSNSEGFLDPQIWSPLFSAMYCFGYLNKAVAWIMFALHLPTGCNSYLKIHAKI
jgi:hypothetical protein